MFRFEIQNNVVIDYVKTIVKNVAIIVLNVSKNGLKFIGVSNSQDIVFTMRIPADSKVISNLSTSKNITVGLRTKHLLQVLKSLSQPVSVEFDLNNQIVLQDSLKRQTFRMNIEDGQWQQRLNKVENLFSDLMEQNVTTVIFKKTDLVVILRSIKQFSKNLDLDVYSDKAVLKFKQTEVESESILPVIEMTFVDRHREGYLVENFIAALSLTAENLDVEMSLHDIGVFMSMFDSDMKVEYSILTTHFA